MLVVFAGRPGTGKTTLSRTLAAEIRAAVLRIDAIETAMTRNGFSAESVGQMGYVIAHEIAAGCLAVGTSVIIDAVNPVHEAREGWLRLAELAAVPARVIEVQLDDIAEHRRRVEQRRSDLEGQKVPTWDQVVAAEYQPWDEERDGTRLVVNGSSPDSAVEAILSYLRLP